MHAFIRVFIISCISLLGIAQADHMSEKSIDERTSPVGQVNVAGMVKATEAMPASTVPDATAEPAAARTGETIYNNLSIVLVYSYQLHIPHFDL